MGVLTKAEARDLYDDLSSRYDRLLRSFSLLGVERQRRRLIGQLGLGDGDTVADLCCGTGANLSYLWEAVGPTGTIIGVDLSRGMLDRAQIKIDEAGWDNVRLIEADVETWDPPEGVHVVISTFGLEMVPAYAKVIERLSHSLRTGARLGLLGLKKPEKWPDWLIGLAVRMDHSFGVTRDYEDFKPWLEASRYMYLRDYDEMLLGAAYRCVAVVK